MTKKKYLEFKELPIPRGRKTKVFAMYNTSGEYLGEIHWRFGWRQYVLHWKGIEHSRGCLLQIADFLKELMDERNVVYDVWRGNKEKDSENGYGE